MSSFDHRLSGGHRLDDLPNSRKRPRVRRRRPGSYEKALPIVRAKMLSLQEGGYDFPVTAEGVGAELGLDSSLVKRAFGQLRIEGVMSAPMNRAPGNTWRGGGYNEYSGWYPTTWRVRRKTEERAP